ncbi:MAG TPA: glycosyltransferase family 39 protein [Methanobacterium sp.]|nr:glycosyltransferase family 39 protein [Methanobacterium sp.]
MNNLAKSNILKKYNFYILMAILAIIISLIAYYKTLIQIELGPEWDTYDFLANALVFAGKGIGYSDPTRPPIISFLTSIFFDFNYVSESVILIIDGIGFILGVIGLYLLFNLRFNPLLSFLGSLLFATFPIVLRWVSVGYSDIFSISILIWVVYLTIMGIKRDSRYFYLSFPLLMTAFLTRYSSALIIIPIGFYIIVNRKYINLKNLFIGILLSFLVLVPVLIFFAIKFGNPLLPFLIFVGGTQQAVSIDNFAFNPDPLYFINRLPLYISAAGVTAILVSFLGIFLYLISKSKKVTNYIKSLSLEKIKARKIEIMLFIILFVSFMATFSKISYIASEIIFFFIVCLLFQLLKNLNKNIDMDLLFLSWFMVYFIFNSVFMVKVDRYFISMAPALSYFLMLGLSWTTAKICIKFKNINLTSVFLVLTLISIIFISTFSFLSSIPHENSNTNVVESSNWLKDYDPNYQHKIIYTDYFWPNYSWYLKMNVKAMPLLTAEKSYDKLEYYKPNNNENIAYNKELSKNNVDYYFSIIPNLNLTSYQPIKRFGFITLYKKTNQDINS